MRKWEPPSNAPPSVGDATSRAHSTSKSPPQPSALNPALPAIPDHELICRIGAGSYGEVWLARNTLGTYRAVKIVHRHSFEHDRPFEREFAGIKKFEPVSRSHEGLVDLLQVGRNDAAGYFYYVMELADDANAPGAAETPKFAAPVSSPSTLHSEPRIQNSPAPAAAYEPKTLKSELIRRGRLPLDECIQLGLSLTNALAYLHGQGLVHRDIKPSNVIYVGGVPKLADVGLVTGMNEARSYVGTEGFIPPEGPGTPQADLYSLGIALYELSTGKNHHDFPEPLADLATQPDHARWLEFNAVIHRACRAEVCGRYQTAEKMHNDLTLLLAGHSVKHLHRVERRLSLLTRIGKLVSLLAVIAAGLLYQMNRERKLATQSLVRLHVTNGTRMMDEGDLFGSLLSFTEALRLDHRDARREESDRIRIASVLRQCPKLIGVFEHEHPVNEAVLSPDDRWLLTGSDDYTAKVWDLASGTNRLTLQHQGVVYSVRFSPDGSLIVTSCVDGRAHLWGAATGEEFPRPLMRQIGEWASGPTPSFSPDGRELLTLVDTHTLQIWNVATGQPIGRPLQHDQAVRFAAFSPDGHRIVSVSDDNQARVWDSFTGALQFCFPGGGWVNRVAISPDSRVMAATGSDRLVRLWDLSSGKLLPASLEHQTDVSEVAFSPEGDRLLTRSWDHSVHVWDVEGRKPLILPIAHDVLVSHVSFSPDGRSIATVRGGNLLQVWNADTGELKIPSLQHGDWRERVVFSSDGRLVVTFHGAEVRVWDIGTIEPPPLPIPPVVDYEESSTSPNGRFEVVIGDDNTVRAYDRNSDNWLPQLIGLIPPIRQAIFGTNSEILITESADTRASIWDPIRGEPLTPLLKTRYSLNASGYQPNTVDISKRDLPRDDRPVAELVRLAQLLSGHRIDETGGFRPVARDESLAIWRRLKAKYPEAFRTSPEEVFSWHQQEAKNCEQAWNWWAAIFHLNYLIASHPEDESLRKRRAYAQKALENARQVPGGYLKQACTIPPRNPSASADMVDLSKYYNRSLKEIGATLPNGLQTFAGTRFDVRGLIQLASREEKSHGNDYREQVTGIRIGRKCREFHFLHATTDRLEEGRRVGAYVVHYADQQTQTIPIVYGENVRSLRTNRREWLQARASACVWVGSNPQVQSMNRSLRMFELSWKNPLPNDLVVSLDFVSSLSEASPFLVAVTTE